MKKRLLLAFFSVFVLTGSTLVHASTTPTIDTQSAKGSFNVLVKAIGDWQDLKHQKTEKEIALKFEQNLSFPSLKEIDRIENQLKDDQAFLRQLQQQTEPQINVINEQQVKIEALNAEKRKYEETYAKRKEKQQNNLKQFEEDLEDIQEGIEKQRKVIKAQITQTVTGFLFIVAIVLVLLVLKFIFIKVVSHFSSHLSEQRREILLRVFRISFNILIIIVLIGTVSSQFMSLLPFLALLGTGIAFAVRDSLSSFLAWFLIGGDDGYKKGDIIAIKDTYGRVLEVTPFLTLLKEIKGDHETGEIITFPNKVIFEQEIVHVSRYQGFVNKHVSFLLAEDSDIDEAKKLLLQVIQEIIEPEREEHNKNLEKLRKTFDLTIEETMPVAWVQHNDHGMNLQGRFLVRLKDASFTKNKVEESFMKNVQKSKKIHFHFTDSGRNSKKSTSGSNQDRDADHFH